MAAAAACPLQQCTTGFLSLYAPTNLLTPRPIAYLPDGMPEERPAAAHMNGDTQMAQLILGTQKEASRMDM